ncbi:MAG: hypothetical protein WA849_17120, partial [Candidatus Udaeobacter sp.]
SRPYFRGYQAWLGDRKLPVTSYRGLFPMVEVPAGTHGLIRLTYRPYWLVWGGSAAIICALGVLLSFATIAWHTRSVAAKGAAVMPAETT